MWEKEEDEYLISNFGKLKTVEIARNLNRSIPSVQARMNRLNLKLSKEQLCKVTGKINWTKGMDDYIKEKHGKMTLPEIAKELGISRKSLCTRITKLSLQLTPNEKAIARGHKPWSKEQTQYLIDNYSNKTMEEIRKELGLKSIGAVASKAKALGLSKETVRWSKEQQEFLENKWGDYSIEYISKKLGISIAAIKTKAQRLGLGEQLACSGNYIGIKHIADILNVKERRVYDWVYRGLLGVGSTKIGANKLIKVKYKDFISFLEQNQNLYTTYNIDLTGLKMLFTKFNMRTTWDDQIVVEFPDWLKDKIAKDKQRRFNGWNQTHKPWTLSEELRALNYKKQGMKEKEIAKILNRSYASVYKKIKKLEDGGDTNGKVNICR